MSRRLSFGAYSKDRAGGLAFEQYVLNALTRIEKWSHDVQTRYDAEAAAAASAILLETGDNLLREQTGNTISLES